MVTRGGWRVRQIRRRVRLALLMTEAASRYFFRYHLDTYFVKEAVLR